jgi:uncharacterized membrane protein HdeD (DUF308 family)
MELGLEEAAAWSGPFWVGLLLAVLGGACVLAAFPASLASVVLFGGFLIAGGVLDLLHGIRAPYRGSRPWHWLGGILSMLLGVLMLARPVTGLASLTLLLACYYFAIGFFRLVVALADRHPGRGADILYGILTLIFGVIVVGSWPSSSLWLLGTLVGAEIIVRGVALMAASLTVRRLAHHPAG